MAPWMGSLWCTFGSLNLLLLYRPSVSLLPPQNITVDFLDFVGNVRWLPGQDNPLNTAYTFQLRALGAKEWIDQRNCVHTVAMACALDIPLSLEGVLSSYQVRGQAEGAESQPAWGYLLNTVQPYDTTLLSAPSMKIWVEDQSVHVSLTHPQTVHTQLSYNIVLQQSVGGHNTTVAVYPRSGSERIVPDLPPERLYCLTASANHGHRHHMTTEECVYLPGASSDFNRLVGLYMGVGGLLALIGLITGTCSCSKARDHTPMVPVRHTVENVLTPEAVPCASVRLEDEEDEEEEEEEEEADHTYLPVAGMAVLNSSRADRRGTDALPAPPAPLTPPTYTRAWDDESFSLSDTETPHGATDMRTPHGATDMRTPHGATDMRTPHGATDMRTPHGATDMRTPHGATDTETPHRATDMRTPHGATDMRTPHGATDMRTPHGATDMRTPHRATDMRTPHGATDMRTPHGATDMRTPHGATDMRTPHGATDMRTPHGATDMRTPHGATDMWTPHGATGRMGKPAHVHPPGDGHSDDRAGATDGRRGSAGREGGGDVDRGAARWDAQLLDSALPLGEQGGGPETPEENQHSSSASSLCSHSGYEPHMDLSLTSDL